MEINEKQARSFRNYFMEYAVLFLIVSVVTLFGLYYNLNQYIMSTVMTDKAQQSIVIERNTQALQLLINKTNQK
jgi:hypothetical protein